MNYQSVSQALLDVIKIETFVTSHTAQPDPE